MARTHPELVYSSWVQACYATIVSGNGWQRKMTRILIVEDDAALSETLAALVRKAGFAVDIETWTPGAAGCCHDDAPAPAIIGALCAWLRVAS